MKKLLFILASPVTLILPLSLISCSQNNDEIRIAQAKEKIQEIILAKPLPTLKNKPIDNQVLLSNYLKSNDFVIPTIQTTGVEIDLHSIELPIVGEQNLIIWFKVTSTDTLDIAPEIADFYSINFFDIVEVKGKTIVPVEYATIEESFQQIIEQNIADISAMVTDAIFSKGIFLGDPTIDTSTLEQDPKPLNDRLTTSIINEHIFEGYQKNVYMVFDSIYNSGNEIIFDFKLGASPTGTAEEVITFQKPINIFQARKI